MYSRRRDTLPKPAEGDLAPSNWDLPTDEGQGLEGQNRYHLELQAVGSRRLVSSW